MARIAQLVSTDEDAPLNTASLQGLSLEEFLALPEVKPALEYAEGEVSQKVAPQFHPSRLQYHLCLLINRVAEPRKIAMAFPELRATGSERSYVPDVSIYTWDRLPRSPEGELAARASLLPDVAVEIVSPDQRVTALVRKCIWFLEHGVRAALIVDAEDRTVFVFRPRMQPLALTGAGEIDLSDIVPEVRFQVAELFSALRVD